MPVYYQKQTESLEKAICFWVEYRGLIPCRGVVRSTVTTFRTALTFFLCCSLFNGAFQQLRLYSDE